MLKEIEVKNGFIDKYVVYRTFSVFLRLCPFAPADIVLARKNSVHGFKSTSDRSLAIGFGPKITKNPLGLHQKMTDRYNYNHNT